MAPYLNLLLLALPVLATESIPAPAPSPQPVHYVLDSKPGDLEVMVFYDREALAAAISHDHVVTPTRFTGSVDYDVNNPASCDVKIVLFVSDLVVDATNARSKYKLPDTTSDANKATIKKNMLASNQLNASAFNRVEFKSSSCTPSGGQVFVKGALSIHGFSHNVNVPMTIQANGKTFSASGRFTAQHSDFGMDPYTAMFGALKNAPKLAFHINVSGRAK
jgi:polyisoprenoid-binding protein YceI